MRITDSIRQFSRNEKGGVIIEFLLLLPLLIWAMIAMVIFWDVFRTINTAQKAAYSISDVISRQENNLSPAFVNGMADVFDFLTLSNSQNPRMRITSAWYDEDDDKFYRIFSVSPDNKVPPYSASDVESEWFKDMIPMVDDGDSVVIVESSVDYVFPFKLPFIDAGVVAVDENAPVTVETFTEFVVTRPRFRTHICLDNPGCPLGI
jgi:Flp pilus assembly pilin Flp